MQHISNVSHHVHTETAAMGRLVADGDVSRTLVVRGNGDVRARIEATEDRFKLGLTAI